VCPLLAGLRKRTILLDSIRLYLVIELRYRHIFLNTSSSRSKNVAKVGMVADVAKRPQTVPVRQVALDSRLAEYPVRQILCEVTFSPDSVEPALVRANATFQFRETDPAFVVKNYGVRLGMRRYDYCQDTAPPIALSSYDNRWQHDIHAMDQVVPNRPATLLLGWLFQDQPMGKCSYYVDPKGTIYTRRPDEKVEGQWTYETFTPLT
jgi:hypothetical protein